MLKSLSLMPWKSSGYNAFHICRYTCVQIVRIMNTLSLSLIKEAVLYWLILIQSNESLFQWNAYYYMTRTAHMAWWREQVRKKPSGPARIAYGPHTGILSIARARCELKQLFCYINPDFSIKMTNIPNFVTPWPRAKYFPVRPSHSVNKYIILDIWVSSFSWFSLVITIKLSDCFSSFILTSVFRNKQ